MSRFKSNVRLSWIPLLVLMLLVAGLAYAEPETSSAPPPSTAAPVPQPDSPNGKVSPSPDDRVVPPPRGPRRRPKGPPKGDRYYPLKKQSPPAQ